VGVSLLGRGEQCQVVVDDGLVSRQHARVVVDEKTARLEDVGSSNGVYVNGAKVETAQLNEGDVIGIGKQRITFHAAELKEKGRSRTMAETLHGSEALSAVVSAKEPERDPLELLSGLADKALALGRGSEAERMLSPHLLRVAEAAREGGTHPAAERAVAYAARLADATRKPLWVDYCFELYSSIATTLPESVVEQLYSTLRNVVGVSRRSYRDYLATLERVSSQVGPRQRFLMQRIAGLEALIR
jgi:pSer/pThr/pTyr-binding forkhead associated (FHA) protein